LIWYIGDLARHKAEREALEALAGKASWFNPAGWRVDDRLRLILAFDIVAGGQSYALQLRYPESFPNSPPSVIPVDSSALLSGHQYGPGGELCLEIRADNWTPDLMGYQIIESAYRLLSGENPAPNERAVVPSAHETTLGQELRSELRRLTISRDGMTLLRLLPEAGTMSGKARFLNREDAYLYVIDTYEIPDNKFTDPAIPTVLALEGTELNVSFVRLTTDAVLPGLKPLDDFKSAVAGFGADPTTDIVVLVRGEKVYPYRIFSTSVHKLGVVRLPKFKARLGADHGILVTKHVALIGCGSMGSKIATSLARSAVGKFLLVDDDVLTLDNFVRNDLDWRDVGLNKADALSTRLKLVNPAVTVRARRVQLAGQESAESADSVVVSLAECDLIIDATANPAAFNVIAGIAGTAKKPVVWAEVFAGGIGGLIARCRPGLEPPIPLMRRAIENWFEEQGAPPVRGGRRYDQDGEENPMVADDADVTAIAAPAARMAIDCLLSRDPSFFPHSVYAIGLAPGSIFTQAFEVFPITLGEPPREEDQQKLSTEDAAAEIRSILQIITSSNGETNPDKKDG